MSRTILKLKLLYLTAYLNKSKICKCETDTSVKEFILYTTDSLISEYCIYKKKTQTTTVIHTKPHFIMKLSFSETQYCIILVFHFIFRMIMSRNNPESNTLNYYLMLFPLLVR